MNNEAIQGILEIVKIIFKTFLEYWWIFEIIAVVTIITEIIKKKK